MSEKKDPKELDSTLKQVLVDFGGEDAIKIMQVLLSVGSEITDEKLAEQSGVRLNIVRKILYILNENKLTQFHRQRDKKSGWFVYYWIGTAENLPLLLEERKKQVVEKLMVRLKFERIIISSAVIMGVLSDIHMQKRWIQISAALFAIKVD